jgi:dethiobiotin synthetase
MTNGIFVSGTSTGVGKTVISALICKKIIKSEKTCVYYKPVQTGAVSENGKLISTDCRFVKNVSGKNILLKTECSYLLKKPASPHFSAQFEHVQIDMNKIKKDYKKISSNNDFVVLEGAGGILVPINENGFMMADIPELLSLDILLVGNAGLGTINHVLLNYYYLKSRNLKISHIVLITEEIIPTDIEKDNLKILKNITGIENIFHFPKVKNVDTDENQTGDIEEKSKFFDFLNF